MTSESELLAARYGKTPSGGKASRNRIIALAVTLITLFLAWAIWVTIDGSTAVKSQVIGYEVIDAGQTSVRYSVDSPSGPAKCAIQVLNQGYAVVGYKEVEVAASGEFETFVNTTELGVTGLVDKCWLK